LLVDRRPELRLLELDDDLLLELRLRELDDERLLELRFRELLPNTPPPERGRD